MLRQLYNGRRVAKGADCIFISSSPELDAVVFPPSDINDSIRMIQPRAMHRAIGGEAKHVEVLSLYPRVRDIPEAQKLEVPQNRNGMIPYSETSQTSSTRRKG